MMDKDNRIPIYITRHIGIGTVRQWNTILSNAQPVYASTLNSDNNFGEGFAHERDTMPVCERQLMNQVK